MSFVHRVISFGVAAALIGVPALPAWGADEGQDSTVTTTTTTTTSTTPVKMKKHHAVGDRSLASLAPVANRKVSNDESQGTVMLNDVKSTSPRFMRTQRTPDGAVSIAGTCRAADGAIYDSGQKGYQDCLDARTTGSGNVSDYFSAYNQAGVGIKVSK